MVVCTKTKKAQENDSGADKRPGNLLHFLLSLA